MLQELIALGPPAGGVLSQWKAEAGQPEEEVAVGVAGVWLLWSWTSARLLQAFIVGPACAEPIADLGRVTTWAYVIGLITLAIAGVLAFTGGLI